ncbi:transporter substrate-binding domain-containing protein [Pseudodesulfovibrio cashew]|uniref:Transporter substrate-binding domain-containing protein n=1 Tax=Pseudodesulfovibrio cashew TaxID=2678688 RepID=A0A6I6JNH8_9BACT|nr:transporter substrate-binding domain-containing protein [Pseudodesulfovibrio cashew]QGY41792.1 transporter substrate-binding domain-containing protein [Pseudodesulfovibrio cashew]
MLQRTTILIALFLSLFMAEASANNPTIIVVGDHSPPFRIFEDGRASGIYFDTIKEISKRMGFTPKFVQVPFKRALDMMRKGTADMMPGPNYTKERACNMVYTAAMLPAEPKAFYYRNPQNRILRFDDLQGKSVASTLGKDYNHILEKSPRTTLELVRNYELAIQKVLFNRNDLVILPEFQGDYLLHTRDLKLFKSPFKLPGKPSHICLSRNSHLQGRQEELRKAMESIIADGTFQKILDRYSPNLTTP